MIFSRKIFSSFCFAAGLIFFGSSHAVRADNVVTVEVGFSQDGEPEPHLVITQSENKVLVYQIPEAKNRAEDQQKAKSIASIPSTVVGAELDLAIFNKRLKQATESLNFFSAPQRGRKHCKDLYVVRIQMGKKYRERRGCSNQNNDQFAGFAQNIFREAFGAWNRAKRAP